MTVAQNTPIAAASPRASRQPRRFRGRRWMAGAAGLAAAGSLVVAVRVIGPEWPGARSGPSTERPELKELVAALAAGSTRPVEGRLTGGFEYAPLLPATRGTGDREVSPEVRIASARLAQAATRQDTPENEAALGVARLALGDVEKAVSTLEAAVIRRPDDAAYHSDLSVAYMASARERSRDEDWPKALAAAERALRRNPSLIEALYNRALALERLHLDEAARSAWDQYRSHDPDSAWTREAARGLPPPSPGWEKDREVVVQAATGAGLDDSTLERIAAAFPEALESHLEDVLLPQWAAATVKDGAAAERLALLSRRVGTAVSRRTQDRFPLDLIAAPPTPRTAAAFEDWRRARELYEANQIVEAGAAFRRAAAGLPAGHPLTEWTAFHEAVVAYYGRDFALATGHLDRVASIAVTRGHTVIRARTEWMLGLIAGVRGDFVQALERYARAEAIFAASNCRQQLAKVHDLLADVNGYLGDEHTLWRHRLAALSSFTWMQNRRWRQVMLETTAVRLLREGNPEAALHFQKGAVDLAVQSGDPIALTEALLYRCRTLRQLDRLVDASTDLQAARRSRQQVAPAVGASLDIDLALEASALQAPGSLEDLARAIEFAGRHELKARLPYLLIGRARALRREGRLEDAERQLHQAIELAQQLAFTTGPGRDIAQLDEFGKATRELIAWQVASGRAADALETVEWARAPLLRRTLRVTAMRASSPAARPDGDTVRVYFQPLIDDVAAWRVDTHGVTPYRLGVSPGLLDRHIHEYVRAMLADGMASRRAALARTLYDELLGRVLTDVPRHVGLELVVEGSLSRLPFASLVTPENRYLIEDRPVALTPSASISHALRALRAQKRIPPESVLVIAGDQATPAGGLPGAGREASDVAARYTLRQMLADTTATPAMFGREASRYDVIHFAGHAVPNPEFPALSRLVFSSATDRAQAFIFARDIEALRLKNAPVVVLSACETNIGRASFSEGVLSLARSFLAAGAVEVVASGWKVDDEATRPLMAAFHRSLRTTGDAASALRSAQVEMIGKRAPVNQWAAFVVVGSLRAASRQEVLR